MEPAVQHLDQQLRKYRPHAAGAAHQHVRAQQHHRPHGILGERLADARRVAANEIELQLPTLLRGNPYMRELPEPRVDAVHGFPALDRRFDGTTRLLHCFERLRVEGNGNVMARDGDDISDGEGLSVKRDRRWLRHGPKS